jgi:hypothetical protein
MFRMLEKTPEKRPTINEVKKKWESNVKGTLIFSLQLYRFKVLFELKKK